MIVCKYRYITCLVRKAHRAHRWGRVLFVRNPRNPRSSQESSAVAFRPGPGNHLSDSCLACDTRWFHAAFFLLHIAQFVWAVFRILRFIPVPMGIPGNTRHSVGTQLLLIYVTYLAQLLRYTILWFFSLNTIQKFFFRGEGVNS